MMLLTCGRSKQEHMMSLEVRRFALVVFLIFLRPRLNACDPWELMIHVHAPLISEEASLTYFLRQSVWWK